MARKKKSAMDAIDFTVSPRDREIWEAVEVQRRKQIAVADEYKLSKPRITAILKRVEHWMGLLVPTGLDELPREARLRAACRRHMAKLRNMEEVARAAFEDSKKGTTTIKRRFEKGELVYEEQTAQAQRPDRKYWADAITAAEKQMAFEGVDVRGQLDVSCAGRIPEAPETTDVELHREVKMRAIRGDFDTPGDEGVPGAWRAEMEFRNATVAATSPAESSCTPRKNAAWAGGSGGPSQAAIDGPQRGSYGEVSAQADCRELPPEKDASFHGVKGDCGGTGAKVLTDNQCQYSQDGNQTNVKCDSQKSKVLTNSPPNGDSGSPLIGNRVVAGQPQNNPDRGSAGASPASPSLNGAGAPPPKRKWMELTPEERAERIKEKGYPTSNHSEDFDKPRLPGTPKVKKPPA